MGLKSSTSSSPNPSAAETLVVGAIRRPHGLKGELVVEVLSDVADRISPGARLLGVDRRGERRWLQVTAARPHQSHLLVRFAEVDDRTAAEALQGGSLEIERHAAAPLPAGSFYQFELLGCGVWDRREGELGRVADVLNGPGGILLALTGARGEILVPFVESYLERVDVAGRRIEIRLPEGFVEACGSKS